MKQFDKILKFELKNYFTNKVFVGITVFLMAIIMIVMCFPRFSAIFAPKDDGGAVESRPIMIVTGENADFVKQMFEQAFTGYQVVCSSEGVEQIKQKIVEGQVECAFVLDSLTSYNYLVNNLSMYDTNTATANQILQNAYRLFAMINFGLTEEQASKILTEQITFQTTNLGKDQVQNFFYTYIMIFALYMVILLYGQMVASNVATEKSSRAMELLITSAKPLSMMFGKILASCIAGFLQLVAIFGSALLFFNLNKTYWADNMIINSIFNMPFDLFLYMLLFFVLGFLIYACLFGAVGSMASKLEDINTTAMPIQMLFIAGFLVVMMSMASGEVDTLLMKVCSFIPFTSPMAMFTRIAMSTVPVIEIIISIAILIVSVVGFGILSAKIYRVGVLMYGTPPKISAIIKAIKKS